MRAFEKAAPRLGGAVLITAVSYVAIAYIFGSVDGERFLRDGFGRQLFPAPPLAKLLGAERLWRGWPGFVADFVGFWGSIALGLWLLRFSEPEDEDSTDALSDAATE